MTGILIEPVSVQSIGSYPVEITAIDPTSPDCLIGTITTPGQGTTRESWNLNGLMRGGSDPVNLEPRSDELADLVKLAKHLGAPA